MELSNLKNNSIEIVLISIQDIKKLKQSYPNYFMDTTEFIKNIDTLFKLMIENDRMQTNMNNVKDEKLRKIAKTMSKSITKKMLELFHESKK